MKILHLQTNGNIRTWKQAKVMADAGHEASMGYVKNSPSTNLPGLDDSVFSDVSKIDMKRPKKWIAEHSDGCNVVHAHNDDLAWHAEVSGRVPVMFDVHDLASLVHEEPRILDLERRAIEGADGVMVVCEGVRERVIAKYGTDPAVVENWPYRDQVEMVAVRARDRNVRKLSAEDGVVHVVYAGRIGKFHRDFRDTLLALGKAGIRVTVYTNNTTVRPWMRADHPNVFYVSQVPPGEMIFVLRMYDAGIIPYDYEPYRTHLDSTMSHKFWDYLAAGIPVFVREHEQYRRWLMQNPGSAGATYTNVSGLITLVKNHSRFRVWPRHVRLMEEQVPTMERAYEEAAKKWRFDRRRR